MKRPILAVLLFLGMAASSLAQTVSPAKKAATRPKTVAQAEKQQDAKAARANKSKTVSMADASPASPSATTTAPTKKDGTPDRRYKAGKILKKDGAPDMRYKENQVKSKN